MSRYDLLALLLIGLLGGAVYANALHGEFVFESRSHVSESSALRLTRLEGEPLVRAALGGGFPNRPVANLSFALSYYVGGPDVFGYRVVNVAIHVANGMLVYFLALLTLRRVSRLEGDPPPADDATLRWGALFAAALFTAHPIQVQAVTYVVQRTTILATGFYLLSLLFYAHGLQARGGPRRWALLAGCAASGVLALGSKEIAATLPVMMVVYRWYFFEGLDVGWLKRGLTRVLWGAAALGVVCLVYLGPGFWQRILAGYSYADYDFNAWERVLTQLRVVFHYIGLVLLPLPSRLNLLHAVETSRSPVDPITTLAAGIGVVVLVGGALQLRRRLPVWSFALLWFFGNLLIESSLVPLEMVYEHRLYLPMFGVALGAGHLLCGATARSRMQSARALALLIVAALALASHVRNRAWSDPITLWSDVVAKNPCSHRAHNHLGILQRAERRPDVAMAHYRRALEIRPGFARAHNNLANLLRDQGRASEAELHYRKAVEARPDYGRAHANLGDLLAEMGETTRARSAYARAIRSDPHDPRGHFGLGVLAEPRAAVEHFRAALRLDPGLISAANNLAWLLATSSDPRVRAPKDAVRLAERASAAAGGRNPGVLDTLAAAYAAAGEFDRAVATAQVAIDACRKAGDEAMARELEERLRLYADGRPYLEPAS